MTTSKMRFDPVLLTNWLAAQKSFSLHAEQIDLLGLHYA
jgi:hypothetical protein